MTVRAIYGRNAWVTRQRSSGGPASGKFGNPGGKNLPLALMIDRAGQGMFSWRLPVSRYCGAS